MSNTEHRMLNFEGTKSQLPEARGQMQKISKEQKPATRSQRPEAKNFEGTKAINHLKLNIYQIA